MKPKTLLLFAVLSTLFSAVPLAASAADADAPRPQFARAGKHLGGKVIKGLPYSAEVITERQQNLADGNQIINKQTSFSYRDSAGRTRQEFRNAKGELTSVTIFDPVAGTGYFLNPRNKVATTLPAPGHFAGMAQERIKQLRKDGKLPPVRNTLNLRRSEHDEDNVRIAVDGNSPIHIEAESLRGDARRPGELILGPLGGAFADIKWSRTASTRDLGPRDIDGIRAEGKLRSYEIPAGEMGNRNPIVVSDETWFSPELQITVLTRHSDPRAGENVYRLSALKREEPAPALFAVPADYTVKDPIARRHATFDRKLDAPAR